ncbi:MAG: NAD(P)H-hydrate dehydratase [Desulfobacterales bacterium]
MYVSRVSEMRNLDKKAVEKFNIPENLLMENAGLAILRVISDALGITEKKFIIFCGSGNNGGDGFVVARQLHSRGGRVTVFIMGDRQKYRGSAALNLTILENIGLDIREIKSTDAVRTAVAHCDAIIDAMLGTGLMRNIEGLYKDVVDHINVSGKMIFSVDIPSGVNGDTAQVMGTAVKADVTVALGLPKIGNLLYPGYDQCGKLFTTHISFPPEIYQHLKIKINTHIDVPRRNPAFHKGLFGNLLTIAGAYGYYGAPYFSALSFLKAGGGYSRLAAPKSIIPFVAAGGSEVVFLPQAETEAGSISLKNADSLVEIANNMDMVIVGPGLSLQEETQILVRKLAAAITVPLLIDGDGITAVCNHPDIIRHRTSHTILTPHMGEMARITHLNVQQIQKNQIDVLQKAAGDLNAHIVLKGAHTLIGCPDRSVFINLSGNSGMASAGSGDVLTGTICAMAALGLSFENAVRKGVFIHGVAGDLAALEKGEDGITARDILDFLPMAVKTDRDGTLQDSCQGPAVV